jgi:hypothetical protein
VFWVPIIAWIAAVVIGLVVLGFCAYELVWKTNRLRRDLGRLQGLATELSALRTQVHDVQERAARAAAH